MEMNKQEAIIQAIRFIVADKLHKADVTWEEVEQIYAAGDHPDINAEIDYILNG